MRNDTAASGEFRINLPPDVLAEMRRQTGSRAQRDAGRWFPSGHFRPLDGSGDGPPPLIVSSRSLTGICNGDPGN